MPVRVGVLLRVMMAVTAASAVMLVAMLASVGLASLGPISLGLVKDVKAAWRPAVPVPVPVR